MSLSFHVPLGTLSNNATREVTLPLMKVRSARVTSQYGGGEGARKPSGFIVERALSLISPKSTMKFSTGKPDLASLNLLRGK